MKRAYRTLATRLHPDKAGGDPQKFKLLHSAYEVLSDTSKVLQMARFNVKFVV